MTENTKSLVFWRSFPIFETFDDELIRQVMSIAISKSWPSGATLFQRGDEGSQMIALASGRIKLSLLTPQGKELTLRHVEPGMILGEMAILDGEPRSADAVATMPSKGYVIRKSDFQTLMNTYPQASSSIISYLCNRLRDTTEQLETIALYDIDSRVARFLMAALRQLHGDELPDSANLQLFLSQSEIASILGASRPKINRAIMALEDAGAITRNGTVINCNIQRLTALAEPDGNRK